MTESKFERRGSWIDCDWIVFDAVGTLIYPNPSVAEAYQTISARHGSQSGVKEIAERFRAAFQQSESMAFGSGGSAASSRHSSQAIEAARWRWIVGQVVPDVDDLERCFTELWEHFASPGSWSCFHEVEASLIALKQRGYRLAIASNFDSRLHPVCAELPGLKPIERYFVSSETGFRKPAPEFYATVISELNCRARQILMIGDDPEHDVSGPISAGMRALLLDRKSLGSSENSLSSLNQLVIECTPKTIRASQ